MVEAFLKVDNENAAEIGVEIHALSSAIKPVCTWMARDAIQDCRESCGGHGYLKGEELVIIIIEHCQQSLILYNFFLVSGLGDLRDSNDANLTYEGENNVLIQQTSNWLLGVRRQGYEHFAKASPLGSAKFLVNSKSILKQKFTFRTSEKALEVESKYTVKIVF